MDVWSATRLAIGGAYGIDLEAIAQDTADIDAAAADAPSAETAISIVAGTSVAARDRSLAPPLETLEFEELIADPRVSIRHVELNIEEAVSYAQECAALRKEYFETAKLFVDAYLRSEEFFRLDAIHQLEEKAGVYELSYLEAKAERQSGEAAHTSAKEAVTVSAALTADDGLLSGLEAQALTNNIVAIAKMDHPNSAIGQYSGFVAARRTLLELQNWKYNEASSRVAEMKQGGAVAISKLREDYLAQDVTFRRARTVVSRDIAYANLQENIEPGSALNYRERLDRLKSHLDESLQRLAARVRAAAGGLEDLYASPCPLPNPAVGEVIDALQSWIARAQEVLHLRRRSERIEVVGVSMSSMGLEDIGAALLAGAELEVTPALLGMPTGLLRGAALEFSGQAGTHPTRFNLTPPQSAAPIAAGQDALTLRFGRVTESTSPAELRPEFTSTLWNGDPVGTWHLQGFAGAIPDGVTDVTLRLWIARA